VAWVLIRLKGRLLRNSLGGDTARQLTLAASIVGGGFLALMGFLMLYAVRLDAAWGPPLAVVGCAGLAVGWLLFPLLGFGSDETLDPARLALLPIPRRSLILGLLGAATVGVPALATAAAFAGGVLGYGRGAALPLVVAVLAVQLVVCVAGSRALVTALAPALRSRRGRDLGVVFATLAGAGVYAAQLLLPRNGDTTKMLNGLRSAATVLRRTPFGWAGDALVASGDGRYGVALLELAGLVAWAALLLLVWSWCLERAMTSAPDTTAPPSSATGSLAPPVFRWLLPGGRLGAVAARELRYIVREPRRRAQTVGTFVFAGLMPLVALGGQLDAARPYSLLYPAILLGTSSANQLGLDGPAWWLHLATGTDSRSDLAGKNLAVGLVAVPALAAYVVILGLTGSSWGTLAAAYGVALAALATALGFANVSSVRAPAPVPESGNPWATGQSQGCAVALYGLVTMTASSILLGPSLVLLALGQGRASYGVPAVALAVVLGGAAWWVTTGIAARDLDRRGPEVLAAVEPRRA
jgi:ABC-2 type transport system permease protein